MSDRTSCVLHQHMQKLELFRSQVHFLVCLGYAVSCEIEGDLTNFDLGNRPICWLADATHNRAKTSCKLWQTKGFRDIVIGPGVESLHFVLGPDREPSRR